MHNKTFRYFAIVMGIGVIVGFMAFRMLSDESVKPSEIVQTNAESFDRQRVSRPTEHVKNATEREQAPLPINLTDEELEQLEEFLVWLEEEDWKVEQNEKSNNSSPTNSLKREAALRKPYSTEKVRARVIEEEVLDFLASWPATGNYYIRDMLLYREDINGDNADEELRALMESLLAENPNAIWHYSNPRDPNSGVTVRLADGTALPGHVYWADPSYYDRLYGASGEE